MQNTSQDQSPPKNWDRSGLPGWAYFSDELLELEKEELFRKHWQLACHVSDVPEPGNYMTFDVGEERALIVRGRANLLEGVADAADIDRLRMLFDDLEKKDSLIELINLAESGSGVRIFIGSENKLFSLSGSSLVVAPYRDSDNQVVGAVGVIGPTRLNYARVVPMVDYTAHLLSRLSGTR